MCSSGLHASRRIIDALGYAPGNTICRVDCRGGILEVADKLVCRERRIVWRVDGEQLLRDFARVCALQVADNWDPPDIVRQWLQTGDESLRSAADSAARSAAWLASSAAASAAASAAESVQNKKLKEMVLLERKR